MGLLKIEQVAGMNIHYMKYSLDYFLEAQQRAGFQTIELWGGIPHIFMDAVSYQDVKEISSKIKAHDLKVKVFTPENCMYQYQFAAAKPWAFKNSLEYFKNGIRIASELGCTIMQCNSGWRYLDETREEGWQRCVEMLQNLCDFAKEQGIFLAMESLRPEESDLVVRLEDAKKMVADVSRSNMKILVDTTAIGVSGETLEQWFEAFGKDIVHMHFVDGNPYGHLIWGDGCRNMEEDLKVCRKYNYEGRFGQEITDQKYFKDPYSYDCKNMKMFEPYM